mgnify:CR=1 FL=1
MIEHPARIALAAAFAIALATAFVATPALAYRLLVVLTAHMGR